MKYYTYVLIDPRNDNIFYVGKGQKQRMYQHVKDVRRGRIPNKTNTKLGNKINKILSIGQKVKYKKVLITENETEAYNREKELILEFDIKNLCNLNYGGDGGRHSKETKKKISISLKGKNHPFYGKNHTNETKKKISESLKGTQNWLGKRHSQESLKKMSKSKKGKNHPLYGKKVSEETKQKIIKTKLKTFILIDPKGNEYQVIGRKGIKNFIDRFNKNSLLSHKLKINCEILYKQKYHKGWVCLR